MIPNRFRIRFPYGTPRWVLRAGENFFVSGERETDAAAFFPEDARRIAQQVREHVEAKVELVPAT